MGKWVLTKVETQNESGSRSPLNPSNAGVGQVTRSPWMRGITLFWVPGLVKILSSVCSPDLLEASVAGTPPCPMAQVRLCITDQTPFLTRSFSQAAGSHQQPEERPAGSPRDCPAWLLAHPQDVDSPCARLDFLLVLIREPSAIPGCT